MSYFRSSCPLPDICLAFTWFLTGKRFLICFIYILLMSSTSVLGGKGMKINDLFIMVTVAEEMNYARASKRLYVSQSAVTQHIRKIETELGFPLFIRDTHHVALTGQGELFLPAARKIVSLYNETLALCSAEKAQSTVLKAGYLGQVHLHAFKEVISQYASSHPDCQLSISRVAPSEIAASLTSGTYDLIICSKELLEGTGILFHEVYTDHHYCVMNRTHPLAQKKRLQISDLSPYRLLMPDNGSLFPHMQQLRRMLEASGLPYQYGSGGNVDTVTLKLLSTRNEIAVMPGFTVPVHPDLAAIPLDDGISIPVGLAGILPEGSAGSAFLKTARNLLSTSPLR